MLNPIPVDKKEGKICIFTNFHHLNKACPKYNYPTLFIDQIIDDCASDEIFSFMDGFSGYNQIQIRLEDKNKIVFIYPWGTFVYKKCGSILKMLVRRFNGL